MPQLSAYLKYSVILILLFSPNLFAIQPKQMEPGVVGYATLQYEKMSEDKRNKFALLVKCGFASEHLNQSGGFLARAMGSDVPLIWRNWETEIVSYYKGYMQAMYKYNPNGLRGVYKNICIPLLKENFDANWNQ